MNVPSHLRVYPGLTELCKQLSNYIDESGVSRELKDDIDEAKESLASNKLFYIQQLALYTEIKEILLEHNYGIPDQQYDDTSPDNEVYRLLSDLMSTEEAKACLNITMKGKTSNFAEENLFGLSVEDLEIESRKKKILHENIQQICIPQLEDRLKKKNLELFKFWNPSNQDSEGLALAKANQLSSVLTKEKKKLEKLKEKLKKNEELYKDTFYERYEEIVRSLKEVETQMTSLKQKSNTDATKVTVDWLEAKCDYILLKIRVMKNHLLAETYNNETLEALQKIRHYLDEEISKTRAEHHRTKQSLQAYQSVGDVFKDMLEQYTHITTQIDNKKWALSELQKNKDT